MIETWKPIRGYEGYYSVSNLGHVRRDKDEANTFKGRIISQTKSKYDRYCRVGLCKNGVTKLYSVHRLVGLAFIENKSNLPYINHKNGKRKDNRVENLEFVTAKQNSEHSLKHGLHPQGSRAYNAKLNESQVIDIRKRYAQGNISQQKLADEYNMNQTVISQIIRRLRWRHI